jgi:hypothetical protein
VPYRRHELAYAQGHGGGLQREINRGVADAAALALPVEAQQHRVFVEQRQKGRGIRGRVLVKWMGH